MADRRSYWIAPAIAAAIIFYQIILPPPVGIADNGDFAKLIGIHKLRASVDDPQARTFRYAHLRYTFAPANRWDSGYWSSETLLFYAGIVLDRIVSKDGAFDIRLMGVIHAALFLLAFTLLMPLFRNCRAAPRAVLLTLAVLMFSDVMYSAYYNSFYMDAGAFVFLVLAIVFTLRTLYVAAARPFEPWLAVIFYLLFVTAKAQHALLALPLIVFVIWKRHALWPSRTRLKSALAAASIAVCAVATVVWSTPRGYTTPALFNMIFLNLLPSASDPRAELADLGLDDSYLSYSGMYSYESRSPMQNPAFVQEFARRTSYARLGMFYLKHPQRTLKMLRLGLEQAAVQRPLLGNFDRSAGYPPFFRSSAFSVWSGAKKSVFTRNAGRVWKYLLVFGLAVGVLSWRSLASGLALGAAGLIELLIGALADSCEMTRHLFLFNAIWDIAFFGAVCSLGLLTLKKPPGKTAAEFPQAEVRYH